MIEIHITSNGKTRKRYVYISDIVKGKFTENYEKAQNLNYFSLESVVNVCAEYIKRLYIGKNVELYISHVNNDRMYRTIVTLYNNITSIIPLYDRDLFARRDFLERRVNDAREYLDTKRKSISNHISNAELLDLERDRSKLRNINEMIKDATKEKYRKAMEQNKIRNCHLGYYACKQFGVN